MKRALVVGAGFAVSLALALVLHAGPAAAEPETKKEGPPPQPATIPRITIGASKNGAVPITPAGFVDEEGDSTVGDLPRTYRALVRRFGTMSTADSMGNGAFQWAEAAFVAGKFDEAGKGYLDFARRHPRNLRVNDALTTHLLIKEARDFEDRPLLAYARARAHRDAGRPDSANALLVSTNERYPGAKVRHHATLMLAELARDRGDNKAALRWAVAASDTTGKNRLAPFALRIAAESSIALGEPPQKALAYYKEILERYPQSPLAPEARSRSLVIRKRMPQ